MRVIQSSILYPILFMHMDASRSTPFIEPFLSAQSRFMGSRRQVDFHSELRPIKMLLGHPQYLDGRIDYPRMRVNETFGMSSIVMLNFHPLVDDLCNGATIHASSSPAMTTSVPCSITTFKPPLSARHLSCMFSGLVMPKFERELWRTGPKFSPKFRSSAELNAMFDPAFRYTIIQLNASELGSNRTSPRILYTGCAGELGIYILKNLSRTLSILKITTVTVPLHIYNESNGIIVSCIPTWVIKFHVSLATSQPSPVSISIGG